MPNEVKTKNAGTVKVQGGKKVEITAASAKHGLKEGDQVIAFRNDELCDFEVSVAEEGKGIGKHVKDKYVMKGVHVLDAAIMEKQGKGKIVKVHPVPERK